MRLVLTVTVARQWTLYTEYCISGMWTSLTCYGDLLCLRQFLDAPKLSIQKWSKKRFLLNQGCVHHWVRTSIHEHAPGRRRSERPRRRTEASTATACRDRVTLRANRKILEPRTSWDTYRRARRPTATSDRVAFEGHGLLRLQSASWPSRWI